MIRLLLKYLLRFLLFVGIVARGLVWGIVWDHKLLLNMFKADTPEYIVDLFIEVVVEGL